MVAMARARVYQGMKGAREASVSVEKLDWGIGVSSAEKGLLVMRGNHGAEQGYNNTWGQFEKESWHEYKGIV